MKKVSRKMFALFSLVLVAQMVIIWIFGMDYVNNQIAAEEDKRLHTIAESIIKNAAQSLSEVEELTSIIQSSDYASKIGHGQTEMTSYDNVKIYNEFIRQIGIKSDIKDAFIYIPKKETVISSFSVIEQKDIFLDFSFVLENSEKEVLHEYMDTGKDYWVKIEKAKFSNEEKVGILYISPFIEYIYNSTSPKVGIWIDPLKLLTSDREVIPEGTVISFEIEDKGIYCKKMRSGELCIVDKNDDVPKSEYITKEIYHNVYCNIWFPEKKFSSKISRYQLIMSFIFLICILIDLITVYVFSFYKWKPIRQIQKALLMDNGSSASDDQIKDIVKQIEELVQKEKKLFERDMVSISLLKEHYIWRLITGIEIGEEDTFKRQLSVATINFKYPYFIVAVVLCDNPNLGKEYVMDILNSQCDIYLSHISNEQFVILINYEHHHWADNYLKECKEILVRKNIHFNLGVGAEAQNIDEIHTSYIQAKKAMDQKKVETLNSIIYYTEEFEYNNNLIAKEDEHILVNLLKTGKKDDAMELINCIIREEIKKQRTVLEMRQIYLNFWMIAMKSIPSKEHDIGKRYKMDMLLQMERNKDMKDFITELIANVCDVNLQSVSEEDKNQNLIHIVLDYIDHNFMDENMSLTMVAENVGIHKVYLSTIFNKTLNCRFTEYVNRKRIEEAVILLTQGEVKQTDIWSKVGFGSEATYRREFKHYNGVSPKQYLDNLMKTKN